MSVQREIIGIEHKSEHVLRARSDKPTKSSPITLFAQYVGEAERSRQNKKLTKKRVRRAEKCGEGKRGVEEDD